MQLTIYSAIPWTWTWVNLLKHITQLKIVSDILDINNFQILNLQLDERELTSLLLGKKTFYL